MRRISDIDLLGLGGLAVRSRSWKTEINLKFMASKCAFTLGYVWRLKMFLGSSVGRCRGPEVGANGGPQ